MATFSSLRHEPSHKRATHLVQTCPVWSSLNRLGAQSGRCRQTLAKWGFVRPSLGLIEQPDNAARHEMPTPNIQQQMTPLEGLESRRGASMRVRRQHMVGTTMRISILSLGYFGHAWLWVEPSVNVCSHLIAPNYLIKKLLCFTFLIVHL